MLSAKFFEIPNVNAHEKEKIDMDLKSHTFSFFAMVLKLSYLNHCSHVTSTSFSVFLSLLLHSFSMMGPCGKRDVTPHIHLCLEFFL